MARARKIVLWGFITILVVFGIPLAYSTAQGYTIWYFGVLGPQVLLDGRPVEDRVHKGQNGLDVLVSRIEGGEAVTYTVILPNRHVGPRCPSAPWFPIFAEGDLLYGNCIGIASEDSEPYNPPARNLAIGERFVSFVADDGKRVEARW